MVKMTESLIVSFSNMIHVTCVAHGLHKVNEITKLEYSNIDNTLSFIKKVFFKTF